MKLFAIALVLAAVVVVNAEPAKNIPFGLPSGMPGPNPAIDINGYLKISQEAANHRATRRLTEDQFMKMSAEPGTIVLDARSKEKYDLLHVKGAIHLNFSDITVDSLKETIPDKSTRILIYCNNNFTNNPMAFATKLPTASLNISTYIALYNYGYRNIYELGPQFDFKKSKLPFESTPKTK